MSEENVDYSTETVEEQIPIESIPEATFEDIVAEYEQEEGEFEYVVGEGKKARKYVARRLTNLSQKIELTEESEEFRAYCDRISKIPDEKLTAVNKEWKPYLKRRIGKKTAMLVVFINRLLLTPKLSQLQCLRLAAKGGDALMEIGGPLLGAVANDTAEGEWEAIEETKND